MMAGLAVSKSQRKGIEHGQKIQYRDVGGGCAVQLGRLPEYGEHVAAKRILVRTPNSTIHWWTNASRPRRRFRFTIATKYLAHPKGPWPISAARISLVVACRSSVISQGSFGFSFSTESRHDSNCWTCFTRCGAGVHANLLGHSLRAVKRPRLR